MSTRSHIARKLEDGRFESIFCHSDGYPEHNGWVLVNHHSNQKNVDKIFELGNASFIGNTLDPEPPRSKNETFEQWQFNNSNFSTFYARDCGEKKAPNKFHANIKDLMESCNTYMGEYLYIYDNGKWKCYRPYTKRQINLKKYIGKEK